MKKVIIGILSLACIIHGCSPTLFIPASTDAMMQQQLLSGRKLYVEHCGGCHNLHFPKEYDATGWKKHLEEMQPKAKITDEEKQLIFQYLTSQP